MTDVMQLIALKFELVSNDKVRPAFGPVIQGVPNCANVLIGTRCVPEQNAGFFEELADSGTVQVQPVFFYAESQICLPGTQADTKIMDYRIVIVNDTARKCVSSTKGRFFVSANHEQLWLGRSCAHNDDS